MKVENIIVPQVTEQTGSGWERNDIYSRLLKDRVVFLDGDYSDYPEEIYKIIGPIINENFDLVIGSRKNREALSPQARFGNWLATSLIYLFWGFNYTDLGPFRAIKYDKLKSIKTTKEFKKIINESQIHKEELKKKKRKEELKKLLEKKQGQKKQKNNPLVL